MAYLDRVKEFYDANIASKRGMPKGASELEIRNLEKDLGEKLPLAYREYLLWMGNDISGIFVGSAWFLKDVISNNEILPELLEENNIEYELPKKYLAFFTHQGYMAAWFSLDDTSDDPEVYYYTESQDSNIPSHEGKFTDFLLKDLEGLAKY